MAELNVIMNVKATRLILSKEKQSKVEFYDFRPSGHGLNTDLIFRLFAAGLRFWANNTELCMHYCEYLTLKMDASQCLF